MIHKVFPSLQTGYLNAWKIKCISNFPLARKVELNGSLSLIHLYLGKNMICGHYDKGETPEVM